MSIKKQDVLKTILNIAHDITGVDIPKDVNLNSSISDVYDRMEMDSLDEIETIMKLEEHYGIIISNEKVTAYRHKTFDDFCGFVCSLIQPTSQKQAVSLSYKIKQFFQHTK